MIYLGFVMGVTTAVSVAMVRQQGVALLTGALKTNVAGIDISSIDVFVAGEVGRSDGCDHMKPTPMPIPMPT
jgi:hypothetical protein